MEHPFLNLAAIQEESVLIQIAEVSLQMQFTVQIQLGFTQERREQI